VDYLFKSSIKGGNYTLAITGNNVALLPPWFPKKWAVRPTIDQGDIPQKVKISFVKI
jgi:hypothetical protein